MILGDQLRQARAEAHLTQEAAAEALRVSRQTVSNWETGKTYPDILSVLAMSDLYGISLDRLLKGDVQSGTVDYVTYLAECTDTANRRYKRTAVFFLSAPLLGFCSSRSWLSGSSIPSAARSCTACWSFASCSPS